MGTLSHLVFVLPFGGLAALFLCGIEGVKVGAFVVVKALRVLVNNVCGYFIEEGSVVGDDEERRGIGLEVCGKKGDRWDVQHVGRF